MKHVHSLFIILLLISPIYSQNYHWPTIGSKAMSSNFGEFRDGGYHMGIDIKTLEETGTRFGRKLLKEQKRQKRQPQGGINATKRWVFKFILPIFPDFSAFIAASPCHRPKEPITRNCKSGCEH